MSAADDNPVMGMTEMPRYSLSANQEQFDTLFSLLDRSEEYQTDLWDLVRMLNTNKQIFTQILSLKSDGINPIEWDKVFEDESMYKQIYKQEIIMAVMETEDENMSDNVIITDQQDEVLKNKKMEKKQDTQEELDRKA